MTITLKSVFLSAALAALILPAAAQDSSTTTPGSSTVTPPSAVVPPPATQKPPSTQKAVRDASAREGNQQDRIGRGIADGQLTPEEAGKLENQENTIKKETEAARADGTVSAAERARVRRQQDRLSHEINQQKHDGQTVGHHGSADGVVASRKEAQQQQIGKGVADGSINSSEADRLEHQENHIDNETDRLRQNNQGHLDQAQRERLNHQQQRLNHNIHRAKTNSGTKH